MEGIGHLEKVIYAVKSTEVLSLLCEVAFYSAHVYKRLRHFLLHKEKAPISILHSFKHAAPFDLFSCHEGKGCAPAVLYLGGGEACLEEGFYFVSGGQGRIVVVEVAIGYSFSLPER